MKERIENYVAKPGFKREVLSWLVLTVIMLPFILYAFPQAVGAKDALIVKSGSMEPNIPTGSVIIVEGVNTSKLQVDDIITFQSGTNQGEPVYTTHRIINVQETSDGLRFQTKGDNNEDPDPEPVLPENVYAKHVATIPQFGYLLNMIRGGDALLALILVPAVIIILNELYKITQEVSGIKKEGDDKELVQTVLIGVAGLIAIFSALYLSGTGSQLLRNVGAGVEINSTLFGGILMAAMLIAMIVLKFI